MGKSAKESERNFTPDPLLLVWVHWHAVPADYRLYFYINSVVSQRCLVEQAAVTDGDKFSRGLLLDLCKNGDAYTRSTAPDIDLSGWVQTTLDFLDDTEPESSMPVCAVCSSPYGLHLVSCHEPGKDAYLSIRCEECCIKYRHTTGICVPTLALIRPLWKRLMGLCGVAGLDNSAVAYQELLERNFMEKLSKSKGEPRLIQNGLFEPEQGSLL